MLKRNNIEVSVIIVNFNSEENTLNCIKSIKNSRMRFPYEIVVVDNGSRKVLQKYLKSLGANIKYLKSDNHGYGAGNNFGIKHSHGKYIMILNPDSLVLHDAINTLKEFLEKNDNCAIAAPNLYDKNHRLFPQMGSRELTPARAIFSLSLINKILPNNPVSRKYYLRDVSRNVIREADAVPGSAFMIRRDVFERVGGFDEKMFMYFEESDLGKRVKSVGYKLYFVPEAKVIHDWVPVKKESELGVHFRNSRFYYFKKHFGLTRTLLVEAICRLSFYDLLFFVIFFCGAFLRFYKLRSSFNLNTEVAVQLLAMKDSILGGYIPSIGPPSSHQWLFFSPLFYWLYIPIMIFTKFDPFMPTVVGSVVNLSAIPLYYFLVKKYWSNKTAVLTCVFLSFSPILVEYSRWSILYTYVVPLSSIYFLYLLKSLELKKHILLTYLFIGILSSFHFSAIIFAPITAMVFYIKHKRYNPIDIRNMILGFLIPFIPLFLIDIKRWILMSGKVIAWIPYRITSVLGIIPQSDGYSLFESIRSTGLYFNRLFKNGSEGYLYLVLFGFLLLGVFKYYKTISERSRILYLICGLSLLLLILHGNTPTHYFLIISPFVFIILSDLFLTVLRKMKLFRYVLIFILMLLIFGNFINIFDGINRNSDISNRNSSAYMYALINEVTDLIVKDSDGLPYSLKRIGDFDNYERNFAQSYEYLLWLKGNEPVKVGDKIISDVVAEVEYLIYEKSQINLNNYM